MATDLWVFGYGSLIFRADFPYAERVPASITHWTRRFWQGSTDHRGTESFPGRVVTLISAQGSACWGMAYRIKASDTAAVLDHLDYREKGGYERLDIPIDLNTGDIVSGLTYHAVVGNPSFIGEAPIDKMVSQISQATGPSGPNRDYLLSLEASLKEYNAVDEHVFTLADALRAYEAS